MTKEHRGLTFDVHPFDEGRWEWKVPAVNVGGLEDGEEKTNKAAMEAIDQWVEGLN